MSFFYITVNGISGFCTVGQTKQAIWRRHLGLGNGHSSLFLTQYWTLENILWAGRKLYDFAMCATFSLITPCCPQQQYIHFQPQRAISKEVCHNHLSAFNNTWPLPKQQLQQHASVKLYMLDLLHTYIHTPSRFRRRYLIKYISLVNIENVHTSPNTRQTAWI